VSTHMCVVSHCNTQNLRIPEGMVSLRCTYMCHDSFVSIRTHLYVCHESFSALQSVVECCRVLQSVAECAMMQVW